MPILRPVLPDPGVPFQLIHHDDVASAMRAAVLGRGAPGAYNLAGPGQLTVADLARELGWYSIPVPELAVDAAAEMVARLGMLPAQAQWVNAFREPVIMDTAKARRELRWRPKHDALQTLRIDLPETIDLLLLDGAKALYPEILGLVESRLRPGAFIVADNADYSPDYLARVRSPANGYMSVPFADDVELSMRIS